MKNGRFQAKDIDDHLFLRIVSEQRDNPSPPSCMHSVREYFERSPWDGRHWVHLDTIEACLPIFPPDVIRAKLKALIKRGLCTGCACGCRGDVELTPEGEDVLALPTPKLDR